MKILKSITAWFSGLFTKEAKTMNLTAITTALTVGATTQLTTSESSTYASSDSAVLTVDANGLVTAISAGAATVTATSVADATATATVDFTVTAVSTLGLVTTPAAEQSALEKLEYLIEKFGLETATEIKAGIAFLKSLA